jgi:hypothetical protein
MRVQPSSFRGEQKDALAKTRNGVARSVIKWISLLSFALNKTTEGGQFLSTRLNTGRMLLAKGFIFSGMI